MDQDARHTLLLDSLAEINARLRVLDEAYARLEAAVEHQTELLEILVAHREQLFTPNQNPPPQHNAAGNRSQPARSAHDADRITDREREYSRATHPALFKVIDLLEHDKQARTLSARKLAQQTGISKSWCAIAKRYVLREESVQ
jgi:hypothetical protein